MMVVNILAQTEYPEQLLCNKCTSTFSKMDVLNLIQEILPIVNFIIFNLIMNYLFIFLH